MNNSSYKFHIIIDVYREPDYDDIELSIVREPLMIPMLNHKGEPERASLVNEEIGSIGWEWFLGDDIYSKIFTGRFSVKGELWYTQDYWGECDCGVDINHFDGQNRKTKRRLKQLGLAIHKK